MKHFYINKLSFLRLGLYLLPLFYSSQEIQWQKSLGGLQEDHLCDALATPDYGFLLAGSSSSLSSGNKTSDFKGRLDYWLWKMKESGEAEWQQSYGGEGNDFLSSIQYTSDGGYILAGYSDSNKGGDKTEDSRGYSDYWILRLNPKGEIVWQKTLGGSGEDEATMVRVTSDGGFIIGGNSDSSKSGDKTSDSKGSMDYWIVKLNPKGDVQWQQSYGGDNRDELTDIQLQPDGYVLTGVSNSHAVGDKTEELKGNADVWVIKTDLQGKLLWQSVINGEGDDRPADVQQLSDGSLMILVTTSSGVKSGNDMELVKMSIQGRVLWTKKYDIGNTDIASSLTRDKDGNFLLSGYVMSGVLDGVIQEGKEDYTLVKVDETGRELWRKQYGGKGSDRLKKTIETRDRGLVLAGTSDTPTDRNKMATGNGFKDYWMLKIADKSANVEAITKREIEVYPVPTERYVNVVVPYDYQRAIVEVFDMAGHKLYTKEMKERTEIIDGSFLPAGIYIVNVTTEKEKTSKRIVKL